MLDEARTVLVCSLAALRAGRRIATSSEMIAMTTRSSMSVNALWVRGFALEGVRRCVVRLVGMLLWCRAVWFCGLVEVLIRAGEGRGWVRGRRRRC